MIHPLVIKYYLFYQLAIIYHELSGDRLAETKKAGLNPHFLKIYINYLYLASNYIFQSQKFLSMASPTSPLFS